ncbi:hypothetical protein C3486_18935 [Streptomyces sp. Ru73]|uniref:hypothetical protein n=1 Tax=Streptomyces sp. Ru73 TaxID=2080748 RepID=UPI000CDE281C|nr:hypothetical protein [Streptomyces sp. Ru73]POX39257.1 hypothetical protein C3486_18935 [Streptomyces sp. Ru73]
MARRHLRLTAVVAVVLVSLTGFRPHGHGSHSSGGGGGCSAHSSSSGYHGGSHHYDDDDDYDDDGSSGSGSDSTPSPSTPPRGTVVECVSAHPKAASPGAKVRLSGDDLYDEVTITVEFRGADGSVVDTGARKVDPVLDGEDDAYGDPVFRVPMAHPDRAAEVTRCAVRSVR